MCGIAGYMGRRRVDLSRIHETLELMKNRGPDHQGFKVFESSNSVVALLHSRLGIIDLDARSNQPFTRGEASLVFNGEIYNYIELREELKKKGIRFTTESDTEVLLESYLAWGEACVEKFEGMWSFAIYDPKQGKLFLSRDRFGEKPLYLLETPEGFYFASETKFIPSLAGIPLRINERHLLRYLVQGFRVLHKEDETFFQQVKEVPPATNLVVKRDLKPRASRYWVPRVRTNERMKLNEAVEGFREGLLQSMKLRLRSDVPMAFCLSGGVDSAALTSIAAKCFGYEVASFSIVDQDKRYDESENIRATVEDLGCRNTIFEISRDGFLERLKRLIRYHDAPLYTISYYIHAFLSEAISRDGYKVVASGTGADELVTGYYDHFILHLFEMRNHPEYSKCLEDWKTYVKPFVRNPHLQNPELYFNQSNFRDHLYLNHEVFAGLLKEEFKEEVTERFYSNSLLRNRMLNELFHEIVPPILHEDDLNSMAYSVENRSPYLDSRLFEFAYSIPAEFLIREGYNKYILREAVRGILNEKVRQDRQKKGFNASMASLVDFRNKSERDALLDDGEIFEYLDREKLENFLTHLPDPIPNSYSKFLFNFVNARIFLEEKIPCLR